MMRSSHVITALLGVLILIGTVGCGKPARRLSPEEARQQASSKLDWRVTLYREDTKPYGGSIAYNTVKYFFPGARVGTLSKWYSYRNISDKMMYNPYGQTSLLVLRGLDFEVDELDWSRLKAFASAGNEVLIFSGNFGLPVMESLNFSTHDNGNEDTRLSNIYTGKENIATLSIRDSNARYGYTGRSLQGYFVVQEPSEGDIKVPSVIEGTDYSSDDESDTSHNDITVTEDSASYDNQAASAGDDEVKESNDEGDYGSEDDEDNEYKDDDDDEYSKSKSEDGIVINTIPEVLGWNKSQPDFVRYEVGAGHISLHLAPLATSNYFLLQPRNKEYLAKLWKTFPEGIDQIYWSDYYRRSLDNNGGLSALMRLPPIRWGIFAAIITLLLYVLFGGKKKQRSIPVIKPPENSSVSFVETIGTLYFNQGNNANLAEKMIQHLLEAARTRYYLDTTRLDENFALGLTAKSGMPEADTRKLIQMVYEARTATAGITNEWLHHFYSLTQKFYGTLPHD